MPEKNLELYDKVRSVPKKAQKKIEAGRIKGFTNINPMWRIKALTENFGICGIGWKYEIVNKWIDQGAGENKTANIELNLFIKSDDKWSAPIPGIGGSSFVLMESKGAYTSDEAYKMALTDALSVACKSLGLGADIYWEADVNKYDNQPELLTNEQLLEAKKIEIMNYAIRDEEWRMQILTFYSLSSLEDLNEKQIDSAYKSALKKQGKLK